MTSRQQREKEIWISPPKNACNSGSPNGCRRTLLSSLVLTNCYEFERPCLPLELLEPWITHRSLEKGFADWPGWPASRSDRVLGFYFLILGTAMHQSHLEGAKQVKSADMSAYEEFAFAFVFRAPSYFWSEAPLLSPRGVPRWGVRRGCGGESQAGPIIRILGKP